MLFKSYGPLDLQRKDCKQPSNPSLGGVGKRVGLLAQPGRCLQRERAGDGPPKCGWGWPRLLRNCPTPPVSATTPAFAVQTAPTAGTAPAARAHDRLPRRSLAGRPSTTPAG